MKKNKKLPIKEFYSHLKDKLNFELVAGKDGLHRAIHSSELNRPGLALADFFETFQWDKIQIFGISENKFFRTLLENQQKKFLDKFFSYDIPLIIFTTSGEIKIPEVFIKYGNEKCIPIMQTTLTTSQLTGRLYHYLEDYFAPEITIHGELIDIFGVGTILLGKSGIGKSECALQLIERGHRLVADDLVYIKKYQPDILVGKCSNINVHMMEIRGIGIFDVSQIFGWGKIRYQKKISLIVELVEEDKHKSENLLGFERHKEVILGVPVEKMIIPVKPGRNMALLVEVAALVFRQRQAGIDPAQQLESKVLEYTRKHKLPGSIDNGW